MRVASLVTLGAGVFCVGILAAGERAPSKAVSPLPRAPAGPGGARNLSLAPGLSFTDDSSGAFPIRGDNLANGSIASDHPTAIFFGTSHCYNTNREAERFVALFQKRRDDARFLVVDVHEPSSAQGPSSRASSRATFRRWRSWTAEETPSTTARARPRARERHFGPGGDPGAARARQ